MIKNDEKEIWMSKPAKEDYKQNLSKISVSFYILQNQYENNINRLSIVNEE
jgi:hypothetical protein